MDQQLASCPLILHFLKAYKIFFYLFDMMLFNEYILYKQMMSLKLKYNQFRLVVAEELLDGQKMPEYARHFRQFVGPTFHSVYLQTV
jgi:hypothetical protein